MRNGPGFTHTVNHKSLMALLFSVHIDDQAGFTKLNSPKDDGTGMVDQGGKIGKKIKAKAKAEAKEKD